MNTKEPEEVRTITTLLTPMLRTENRRQAPNQMRKVMFTFPVKTELLVAGERTQ